MTVLLYLAIAISWRPENISREVDFLDNINLKYKVRSDLSIDDGTDSLFVQIRTYKEKDLIIAVVYKPPDVDVEKN